MLSKLLTRFPRLRLIWADAAYAGRLVEWAWAAGGWILSVVRRNPDSHRFEVLPRRWVVERTLAWLSRCRTAQQGFRGNCRKPARHGFHIAMVPPDAQETQTSLTSISHTPS